MHERYDNFALVAGPARSSAAAVQIYICVSFRRDLHDCRRDGGAAVTLRFRGGIIVADLISTVSTVQNV